MDWPFVHVPLSKLCADRQYESHINHSPFNLSDAQYERQGKHTRVHVYVYIYIYIYIIAITVITSHGCIYGCLSVCMCVWVYDGAADGRDCNSDRTTAIECFCGHLQNPEHRSLSLR